MNRSDTLRLAAPLIAMAGVFVARKALSGGYQAVAGTTPPKADDLDEPLSRVLVFAAGAAVLAALVNTVVTREVARATLRAEGEAEFEADFPA